MRATLILLLVLMLVASATAHGDAHEESPMEGIVTGASAIAWVGFHVNDTHVAINISTSDPADVLVLMGHEGAAEPTEWYLFHAGNETYAIDPVGQRLDVTNGTFQRSHLSAADCVVVAAESWQRIDHQRQRTGQAPADLGVLAEAWQQGHACYQPVITPEPVAATKESPLGVGVAGIALLGALWCRRP